MRRLPLLLALACAAAALGACGSGEQQTVTLVRTETVTRTETVEAAPEQTPAETDTTESTESGEASGSSGRLEREFGGTGIDGNIAFTVKGWNKASSVAQEYEAAEQAGPGATFWLVDVAYTNKGKTSVSPFCGSSGAVLIDEEDRNFDHDSSVGISMADNPLCDDLQPGFRENVTLVFKTPSTAKPNSIAVWDDSETDDFSRESYVVFAPKK
jgi:hypothetical protein